MTINKQIKYWKKKEVDSATNQAFPKPINHSKIEDRAFQHLKGMITIKP